MNQSERIQYLAERVLNQQASPSELDELTAILENESGKGTQLLEQLIAAQIPADRIPLSEADIREMSAHIITMDRVEEAPVIQVHRKPLLRKWWWAAASILLLSAIGTYLWFTNHTTTAPVLAATPQTIDPGRSGAILTLADGSQLVLEDMENGVIADQNGSKAVLNNGQLSYDAQGKLRGDVVFNTMSTLRGRQFSMTLPDGTAVWLNAASSIKYPTVFTGNNRQVVITGEVFFDVAKNEKMPFLVNVNNKEMVEVLGTQFNVSAYDNDATINTTLVSGVVRVASTTLKPGQQSQSSNTGSSRQLKVINDADLDKILAWKKGVFNFEDLSLQEVMKQLERWYNIEVVYEKGIPDIRFGGKMSKDLPLDGVLLALEKSEVRFKLEGNKLIVTK